MIDFLFENSLISSKGEGKRLIKQSGIKINDQAIDDINLVLKSNMNSIIKVGKRKFIKIV